MSILDTEEQMRVVADLLSMQFPEMGFALIIFPFENPGVSNYISNGDRDGMIEALRETADRLEKNEVIPAIQGRA